MSLNPLTPVTDYQSMLNRIFWFTSAAALIAVGMLRSLDGVDQVLSQIDMNLRLDGERSLPVPGGTLVPALLVGLASRVFRIHNKLGDWLGVRERFDLEVILHEIGRRSGLHTDSLHEETLLYHRFELMKRCFYQYVSGRQPVIDPQLIERALDMWSWFWIALEAAVVFVATSFILIASGELGTGITTFGVTLGLTSIALPAIRSECRRYAIAQVREILSDDDRADNVRHQFASYLQLDHASQLNHAPRRAA